MKSNSRDTADWIWFKQAKALPAARREGFYRGKREDNSKLDLVGLEVAAKGLDGLLVGVPALLQRLGQEHILHLYGVTLLDSANIPHLVPSVNVFRPSFSQAVPAFHT